MATETFLDLAYERAKSTKRPLRPKLLKLTDVATPHRSRKKTKVKSKDRSTTVRDRIYDDPAYTEDISHLANPLRRSSISGKSSSQLTGAEPMPSSSSLGKRSQLTKDFLKYAVNKPLKTSNNSSSNAAAINVDYDFESSSSDNEPPEPLKEASITRRVLSLERSLAAACEKNEKKTLSAQKRSSKQKRNLSLDNSRKAAQSQQQQSTESSARSRKELSRSNRSSKQQQQQQYLEATEQDDDRYSLRSSAQNSAATMPVETAAKLPIGRRFLRGEIGIKSFNYYLLKEGLKSSKKLDKQRSAGDASQTTGNKASGSHSNSSNNVKQLHTRSEENIYEEIFFKETAASSKQDNNSLSDQQQQLTAAVAAAQSDEEQHHQQQHQQQQQQQCLSDASAGGVYADCELCMQQCSKENCKYCLPANVAQQQQQQQQQQLTENVQHVEQTSAAAAAASAGGLPAAHILEFQSYNPNNPGVYKIETTPVAITGEYNPILQFQQSSATTSTSATTTPSEQQLHHQLQQQHHHQQQQQQQQQQQLYNSFYQQQAPHKTYGQHYAVGGSLLLAQLPPRRQQQQQQQQQQHHSQQQQPGYIVSYQNGSGSASVHRLNTKSSSSSDSLPYHKYNTMARLEANVYAAPGTGDLYYAIGAQPLHPLMYAASRPIGGSQILVDQFESPQMYKSDSRASILSEFSLRSSDNSQRYTHRYPHRSSLFSTHGNAHQRRYFGSTESCRIGYDCRRCSLDGGVMAAATAGMGVANGLPGEKCSYSDNCRNYECRNCDCSSSYFSSDFDDIYGSMARGGSSGIPRKTAAGTLPSSGPAEPADYEQASAPLLPQPAPQMDLKQNKYAMDFFKHVNDVKRSIYQSEMQRNNSLESTRRINRTGNSNSYNSNSNNPKASPKRSVSQPQESTLVVTTLPLSKGRNTTATATATTTKPTPAPRTSLQQQQPQTAAEDATPTPSKRQPQPTERREYPSLDRLVASTTGAIPKRQSRAEDEPKSSSSKSKSKHKEERRERSAPGTAAASTTAATGAATAATNEATTATGTAGKRHHRSNSGKSHGNSSNPLPNQRRKDIPAPPPPSPATYSDLQELKANMEGLQDDTKSQSRSLESETSETPTTTTLAAKLQPPALPATLPEPATATTAAVATALAATPEMPVKCSATMAPKSATEAEDDDVFYDARSEDSAGAQSVVSTTAATATVAATAASAIATATATTEAISQPRQQSKVYMTL